jgi:putative ABC transport system permease protein
VNLAARDVRRNIGRFLGTSLGIALLFTVVLAMAGIYQGLVADATVLLQSMHADLWVVQRGTRGPFDDRAFMRSLRCNASPVPAFRSRLHEAMGRIRCHLRARLAA